MGTKGPCMKCAAGAGAGTSEQADGGKVPGFFSCAKPSAQSKATVPPPPAPSADGMGYGMYGYPCPQQFGMPGCMPPMAMPGMMGMGMYGYPDPAKVDALERSVKDLQDKMKEMKDALDTERQERSKATARLAVSQLPVPDSFARLERWHGLRRADKESISELIVREEELFTELQQSLIRARKDRPGEPSSPVTTARHEPGPPSTPSQSPTANAAGPPVREPAQSMYPPMSHSSGLTSDFFADELRGYRLLRASRISHHEKQNVLVQTQNSTSFHQIRRALRALFSEDDGQHRVSSKIWYEDWEPDQMDAEDAYWGEWEWDEWSRQPSVLAGRSSMVVVLA
eukprot:s182_g30.t1